MRVLITRPEDGGERSAAALCARGHHVLLAPLLRIEPFIADDFGTPPFAAVLFTSANAARAVAAHPRAGEIMSVPVLAVGQRTADAARAAGFADVQSADGDGADLARLVAARFAGNAAPLLYLAGDDLARDLAAELPSLTIRTVTVYRAVKVTQFSGSVRDALDRGGLDAALHFSLRSAEAFVACAEAAGLLDKALALFHYCLSPRVAGPLGGAANIRIAARPDEAALLDLVGTS
jgi:uroporphyrinogen-III synthase